ncbi:MULTISPECIES: LytR/AlgR family response regulator transcription factor [Pedobacter]|uniref:LytTr DNA-binding region n=1 Tax=Pedobacter heparinus (strain ATCC 13125 / DSM 2366 / CIP 104194 / JCM 7457 / NBRC 12017 / NCIMB 9290 / NRRL B-14731 / HIM 762-3) TaxID=485917 RepID=C6XZE7_PEDHD|nr:MULTISPECIES: LytTR family DNA-binding domain-containing protein [Pedobacter]ACU04643.1 LytTr DNA-binding region [Pedobacter heparinus DSM 2366]MBB5437506.1 DNA-binding LytR/AlgR family response regulator [Pedobacter sp. AK017]
MKIIIFEDEKHNAERLIQLLQKCLETVEVLAVIESVEEGLKWLNVHEDLAELIFMDIQLSDGNCFELFKQKEIHTPIIFTTAYDSFALQAFKVYSVDYLMKPIDVKDLQRAIEKYEYFKVPANPALNISQIAEEFFKREHTRFIGKINNQLVYVKARDIAYIYFLDGLTRAINMTGQEIPLDYSLEQMEKLLDQRLFFRINRKLIVHIDAIRKITTYYNSRFVIQLFPATDMEAIISRERVSSFKAWLEGRAVVN